eukprot:scaffold57266_cov51-Phaeocystis_antarctica.AAC.1
MPSATSVPCLPLDGGETASNETRIMCGSWMVKGAVKSATLEAASSNTRGSVWASNGPASPLKSERRPEPPGAP